HSPAGGSGRHPHCGRCVGDARFASPRHRRLTVDGRRPMELGSLGGATGAPGSSQPNAFSGLTSEQFVEIMMTEMQGQDPLEPNDSEAMLNQIANIRSIQSDL